MGWENEMNESLLTRLRGPIRAIRQTPRAVDRDPAEVGRRIWGSPDAIALIFAGSAAEFAVNKAVDWLFWTEALPNAPIERFFETVRFAQAMVFGDEATIAAAVDSVNRAHAAVERSRAARIPQWAYRDVLFMLIDYAERAHTVVFGPMTDAERQFFFEGSLAIARGLHIRDLPQDYPAYQAQRRAHLREDTAHTEMTDRLYASYGRHLGSWRMRLLLDLQASLTPEHVAALLGLKRKRWVAVLFRIYRRVRSPRLIRQIYPILLPRPFGAQLFALERPAR
jgi:uncharacterized protein (DUF2236 family)